MSLIGLTVVEASCQSSSVGRTPAKVVTPVSEVIGAPAVRLSDYVAIFDTVVAKVEKYHAFAPGVRDAWNADKPELRLQFVQAKTEEQATTALFHLQNALRDAHCYVEWPDTIELERANLGFDVFAQQRGSTAFESQLLVSNIDNPALGLGDDALSVGDEVVAIEGVPLANWLRANRWNGDSGTLSAINFRQALADSIVEGSDVTSNTKIGDTRNLTFARGGRTWVRRLTFAKPMKNSSANFSFDQPTSTRGITCRGEAQSPYVDFELTAVGYNLCIYQPKKSSKKINSRARLVRFFSFMYQTPQVGDDSRYLRVDHDTLKRELRLDNAVILDVHENHGGNNPYIFMGWFAGKPWRHNTEHFQVAPGLTDEELMRATYRNNELIELYKKALAAGKSEIVGPFVCNQDGKKQLTGVCPPEGPLSTELVTRAPVAVVVGPQCTSSCDSLAQEWSSSKQGPVVGLQPQRGFTSVRHAFPVELGDGTLIGVFRVALAWAQSPINQDSMEGVPMKLDWEAPYTFATRDSWIDAAVQEAFFKL
jgi:hypothetical protein